SRSKPASSVVPAMSEFFSHRRRGICGEETSISSLARRRDSLGRWLMHGDASEQTVCHGGVSAYHGVGMHFCGVARLPARTRAASLRLYCAVSGPWKVACYRCIFFSGLPFLPA